MFGKLTIKLTLACLATLVFADLAQACPTCKDALQDQATARAFAFSILFMMTMPFLIFGGWFLSFWRMRNKWLAASMDMSVAGQNVPNGLIRPSDG